MATLPEDLPAQPDSSSHATEAADAAEPEPADSTAGLPGSAPAGPQAIAAPQAAVSAPAQVAPDNVGPAADTSGSLERMARLRQLVRDQGLDAEAAAKEVGVDPIIAQLWLRLPDDLWPGARRPAATAPAAASASATASAPSFTPPAKGLRRVLTCRIPSPAYDRLRAGDAPLLEAAATAVENGLALPTPQVAAGGWRYVRRPLAVPLSSEAYAGVMDLAQAHFNGDPRDAAGWAIARGLGMPLPLPTADELAGLLRPTATATTERSTLAPTRMGFPPSSPPRRRPEARAPLPADDSAPNGEELRTRRDAVGISQRDLAAASGLSRGLVAEVERGRRRHVLTRLKLAETLAQIERQKVAAK